MGCNIPSQSWFFKLWKILLLLRPILLNPSQDTLAMPLAVTHDFANCAEILHLVMHIFILIQTKQKTPKNRLPMKCEDLQRRSAFSIRLFLKEFCVEFLNGAYNTLMYHVKVSARAS
jgi:hypothetical protein